MTSPGKRKSFNTKMQQALAAICNACPVCRQARRNPQGIAARLVKQVERHACPFCRARIRLARAQPRQKRAATQIRT
jgi:hypothetical protein